MRRPTFFCTLGGNFGEADYCLFCKLPSKGVPATFCKSTARCGPDAFWGPAAFSPAPCGAITWMRRRNRRYIRRNCAPGRFCGGGSNWEPAVLRGPGAAYGLVTASDADIDCIRNWLELMQLAASRGAALARCAARTSMRSRSLPICMVHRSSICRACSLALNMRQRLTRNLPSASGTAVSFIPMRSSLVTKASTSKSGISDSRSNAGKRFALLDPTRSTSMLLDALPIGYDSTYP
jgi:hypothetical protein